MSDIVKKYQHYFAESVKLQETVNEQAAYIAELEEDLVTISEIFDSPEGKKALASYRFKAQQSLSKAREDRKEAEADADEIIYQDNTRDGALRGARRRTPEAAESENERRKTPTGRERAIWQGGSRAGGTIEDAQAAATKAFNTIQKRKAGIKRAEERHEGHIDAEAKAKGINRFDYHIKDASGRLVTNPYFKERSVEDTPPNLKLPTKK
jgi:hypothetical protein